MIGAIGVWEGWNWYNQRCGGPLLCCIALLFLKGAIFFLKHWPFSLPVLHKKVVWVWGFFCFVLFFNFPVKLKKKKNQDTRTTETKYFLFLPLHYSYLREKENVLLGVFVLKCGVNVVKKSKLPILVFLVSSRLYFWMKLIKTLPNSAADQGLRSFLGTQCFYKY